MTANIKNLILNKLAITPKVNNNNTTSEKPVKAKETKDTYVPTNPPKLSKEEIATLKLDQNNINEINKCCKLPDSIKLVKDKKSGEYKLAKNDFASQFFRIIGIQPAISPLGLGAIIRVASTHKLPQNYKLVNDESGATKVIDMSRKDLSLKNITTEKAAE